MNRPKRPTYSQQQGRRRPSGPPRGDSPMPSRRRSPLDLVPQNVEPRFKVLGTGADRQGLTSAAELPELALIHSCTREIEDAYQKSGVRPDEFWNKHPELLDVARKLDVVLALIKERTGR